MGLTWPQVRECLQTLEEEEARGRFSPRDSGDSVALDIGLLPSSRTVRGYISVVLSYQVCGSLLQQTPETNMIFSTLRSKQTNIKCHYGYKNV